MASKVEIFPIPALTDNYIWCIHDGCYAVVVDPGDAKPVVDTLLKHGLRLGSILITHHHYDHVGGIAALNQMFPNVQVIGPNNHNISNLNRMVKEGDEIVFDNIGLKLSVMDVPGHTLDHIAFYNNDMLFCGDTLFCAGCGRLFEGTPAQMLSSLKKLASLPDSIPVYCTHEYTLANLAFAEAVEPENQQIKALIESVSKLREADLPSLPSSLKLEKQINPFLRSHIKTHWAHIENKTNTTINNEESAFAAVRKWKDRF